jgi:hypothetical protein
MLCKWSWPSGVPDGAPQRSGSGEQLFRTTEWPPRSALHMLRDSFGRPNDACPGVGALLSANGGSLKSPDVGDRALFVEQQPPSDRNENVASPHSSVENMARQCLTSDALARWPSD